MIRQGQPSEKRTPVLGLIHTVTALVPMFDALVVELGGRRGVQPRHVVDEALLAVTRRDGLTPQTMRHLLSHAVAAQESGADAVLVTCSSIGQAVDAIAPLVDVPVIRVDEAMAAEAIASGQRIAVLATLESTLKPTVALIERRAEGAGVLVEVDVRLLAGAFDAAQSGERAGHDELILSEVRSAMRSAEVVVLAQASMERALAGLGPDERTVPVLTSPRFAVAAALEAIG